LEDLQKKKMRKF